MNDSQFIEVEVNEFREMVAKIERYEAALRYYAEKEKYDLKGTVTFVNGSSITLPEVSNIAREALEGKFE